MTLTGFNRNRREKMDKKLKAGWLKALREGRYKQGRGCLHNADNRTYCCLGVLCRVAKLKKVDGEFFYGGETEYSYLPPPFQEKLGMDRNTMKDLARRNDNGESFKEIADFIEKNM
jgi:hypothetical protein